MLIGQYETKITGKRRVAIPKRFRDELGDTYVLARWYEGCIVMVSTHSWTTLTSRVTPQGGFVTSAVRDTDRFLMASAYELSADEQGRIVLPKLLTDHAGIAKDIVFLGLGDRVELWDKSVWLAHEEKVKSEAAQLIERVAQSHDNA